RPSKLEDFSEAEVNRVSRTTTSTRTPTRIAVVSAEECLSVTISPKIQSAKTVFTTQNSCLKTAISKRRRIVRIQYAMRPTRPHWATLVTPSGVKRGNVSATVKAGNPAIYFMKYKGCLFERKQRE
ncbi:hypothetical protein GOODEAATRI_023212, partial [Goodea atripinnis]